MRLSIWNCSFQIQTRHTVNLQNCYNTQGKHKSRNKYTNTILARTRKKHTHTATDMTTKAQINETEYLACVLQIPSFSVTFCITAYTLSVPYYRNGCVITQAV